MLVVFLSYCSFQQGVNYSRERHAAPHAIEPQLLSHTLTSHTRMSHFQIETVFTPDWLHIFYKTPGRRNAQPRICVQNIPCASHVSALNAFKCCVGPCFRALLLRSFVRPSTPFLVVLSLYVADNAIFYYLDRCSLRNDHSIPAKTYPLRQVANRRTHPHDNYDLWTSTAQISCLRRWLRKPVSQLHWEHVCPIVFIKKTVKMSFGWRAIRSSQEISLP